VKIIPATLLLLAALAFGSSTSKAAVDCFLEFDGIAGESVVPGHVGQAEISSFSSSIYQRLLQSNAEVGGAAATRAVIKPLTIRKEIDKMSPKLFLACATGKHSKKAVIRCVYNGEPGAPDGTFLTITLNDVLVASVNTGTESRVVGETVTLNFTKIEMEYRPVQQNGSFGAPVTAAFDLKANIGL
jgi:type VI secretion system secreted protein Hcp